MNRISIFIIGYVILLSAISCNAQSRKSMNKVQIGSHIPSFSLPDQNGKMVDIKSLVGTKNLVIYFYPKDDTPGCTKEACTFRDQYEAFREAGAEVIGISSDGVDSHKRFAEKHRLTFTLLSDSGSKVRKQFGVPTNLLGLLAGRVTYIVNKQGLVVHMFNSQMQAEQHISESLKALSSL
jgi:thioredoxin-dependent peroxiredoxin